MGQGKEAMTVRQVILVIVLIAASFLGGAFVNGPGLRWAQSRLVRYLGLNEEGEIASVDLLPAAPPLGASDSAGAAKPAGDTLIEPLAPAPTVIGDNEATPKVSTEDRHASNSKVQEKSRNGTSSKGQAASSLAASPLALNPAEPGAPSNRRASPDSEVKPAGTLAHEPKSSDSKVEPALFDSLGALLPSVSPPFPESLPSSKSAPRSPTANPTRAASDDWIVLQQKLRALNVSRFTIEGEPSGRVLFSCLIPLAGRQAVAQRFEAEGDDMIQAAQATLRRIALWRATQPQPK
jgi:hypothetical protein